MNKRINLNTKPLIEFIENFKSENEFLPRGIDFRISKGSPYSMRSIENNFGTLSNCFDTLGYKREHNCNKISVDNSLVKEFILEFKASNGKYPRASDFKKEFCAPYSFKLIKDTFGSLKSCYKKLDIPHDSITEKSIVIDQSKLIEYIDQFNLEHGYNPSLNDLYIYKGAPYSKMVLINHFGSINKMYTYLKKDLNEVRSKCNVDDNILLNNLWDAIYKYRTTDRDELRFYSPSTIYDRAVYERKFGSWSNAIKECGVNTENRILMWKFTDYNGENPKLFLISKLGTNGKLTEKQISILSYENISETTIRKYFKSKYFYMILLDKTIDYRTMNAVKTIAMDGHICDSNSEKRIDDYLYLNGIKHDVHVVYPGIKKKCDFKVDDVYIEFPGLLSSNSKQHKDYRKNLEYKIQYAKDKKNNLKLYIIKNTSESELNKLIEYLLNNRKTLQ